MVLPRCGIGGRGEHILLSHTSDHAICGQYEVTVIQYVCSAMTCHACYTGEISHTKYVHMRFSRHFERATCQHGILLHMLCSSKLYFLGSMIWHIALSERYGILVVLVRQRPSIQRPTVRTYVRFFCIPYGKVAHCRCGHFV